MTGLKQGLSLVKATFTDFSDDDATWKAAALSYYTVFALPPLLVLLLQVASIVWDPVEVRRTLTGEFQSLMGQDVAGQIQTMIASAEQKTSGTGLRLLLSIGGLLFGATGALASLQTALNSAWEVAPDPKQGGIKNFIGKRILSLGMVFGIAFVLLVSLALTAFLSAAGGVLFGGFSEALAQALNFVLSFAVVTLLFAAMFKVLPDAKIAWRDVWVGAVVTALLFVAGKFLIGLYVGQSDPGSAFGAAGSLAVLFIWVYYAAVIVLLGAEFTQAWVRQRGRKIEPKEGAVRVVERKERVEEETGKSGTPAVATDAPRGAAATRERTSHAAAELDDSVPSAPNDAANAGTGGVATDVRHGLDVAAVVREHPWQALASAVAAGLALSVPRANGSSVISPSPGRAVPVSDAGAGSRPEAVVDEQPVVVDRRS